MEKIYLGFSVHNGSMVSKTIQVLEGTPYSHFYIRKVSKYGEYIYQASGLAVNFMNIDVFKKNNTIIEEYEFELDDQQKEKLLSFFIEYCGVEYATKVLLELGLFLLLKRIGITYQLKGDGDSSFICSELGALLCKEIFKIDIPGEQDFITPKMLHPYIVANGKRVI